LKNQLSQEQVREWLESPVNEVLIKGIQNYVDELRQAKGVEVFHPFEPQKTQEVLAGLNGAIDSWEDILEVLAGDWSLVDDSDGIETEEP
jgi:hypothetical protein